jgi:hypothetical protein
MVKEEIIEGLRIAVSKGESLEKAMTSFYNAGYKKEEIEEAAAAMVQIQSFDQPISQPNPLQQKDTVPQPTQPIKPQPASSLSKPLTQSPPKAMSGKVSDYEKKPGGKGMIITIVLVVLLLLLLAILAGVILFKTELSNFFNNFFWRALF